jgi:hypothetical protein
MAKAIFEEPGTDDFCIETWRTRDKVWGYGCNVKRFGERIVSAHRLAWIDAHGQLPPDDRPQILHTCDNPPCVNSRHLYAGTNDDNIRDKVDRGRHRNGQREKTHCTNGHEFTPENTRVWAKDGSRVCKTCHADTERRRYNRLRAESE